MHKQIDCVFSDDGSGPAIIMVHGIGARRELWRGVTARLRDRYRCISYNLRGHGDSPMPSAAFSLDDLVDDLEALRAKLGIERAHIVGHSLGGMIGPAYAKRYPKRVLSLGLLSTAAFRTAEDAAKVKAVVHAMREKGIEASLDTLAARWFTDDFARTEHAIVQDRKRQVVETDPSVFLNVFDIYAQTEMAPWLHEVHAPSLVMTGELDGGCTPHLNEQIAAALPNATLVVLAGLKHAILLEAAERVSKEISLFLSALEHHVDVLP
jgi:3-oxoadipate enol-lactonase